MNKFLHNEEGSTGGAPIIPEVVYDPPTASGNSSMAIEALKNFNSDQPVRIGDIELSASDLRELANGSLRQSDYTRKSQELAEQLTAVSRLKEEMMESMATPEYDVPSFGAPPVAPPPGNYNFAPQPPQVYPQFSAPQAPAYTPPMPASPSVYNPFAAPSAPQFPFQNPYPGQSGTQDAGLGLFGLQPQPQPQPQAPDQRFDQLLGAFQNLSRQVQSVQVNDMRSRLDSEEAVVRAECAKLGINPELGVNSSLLYMKNNNEGSLVNAFRVVSFDHVAQLAARGGMPQAPPLAPNGANNAPPLNLAPLNSGQIDLLAEQEFDKLVKGL